MLRILGFPACKGCKADAKVLAAFLLGKVWMLLNVLQRIKFELLVVLFGFTSHDEILL